jgi:hypothetical protein
MVFGLNSNILFQNVSTLTAGKMGITIAYKKSINQKPIEVLI